MKQPKLIVLLACLAALLLLPWVAELIDETYLTSSMSRVLIFAMAAISLDLIVG